MRRIFRNPTNDYRETVSNAAIAWSLLFGWLYFAVRGLWVHLAIQVLIAVALFFATGGPGVLLAVPISIGYAFAAPTLIANRYRRSGWIEE